MFFIRNGNTDPAYNLALEEYALTKLDFPLIMLWRDSDAVIIGRNQNAVEEIDADYVRAHGIAVIRRLSGGGAVFHDLGNVNFTMITPYDRNDFCNYEKFTAPVCDYLRSLGVDAQLQGRNDLVIGGMKFCGNAQAVKNGRMMHHGCILFDADISRLAGALRPKPAKIESKGVKSVRKRVTNIAPHLRQPMKVEEFLDGLTNRFLTGAEGIRPYALTAADIEAVRRLAREKYGSWEWNFGSSPDYNWKNEARFTFGTVEIRLTVEGGVVIRADLFGDFFGERDASELTEHMRGVRHERQALRDVFAQLDLPSYIYGISLEQWLALIS